MSDEPYILDGLTGERRPAPTMTPDQARVAELEAENKALRDENARFSDMLLDRISVKQFIVENGKFDLTLTDKGAAVVTEALIQLFETGGATNFLTWCAIKNEATYRVTIQKDGAALPEAKYHEAQSKVEALQGFIGRIKAALGTDESGIFLEQVAQNAHAAEQALAAVVLRARENPTEHVAHALRAVKVD